MTFEDMLALLKPFLTLEAKGSVATIRLTDDALMAGQDLRCIEALRCLLDHVRRSPARTVLWITTPRCFSSERCDALWKRIAGLNDQFVKDTYFTRSMTSAAARHELDMFRLLFQWLRSVPKPVIATFRGEVALPLLGAGLACEYRIAASDTVFCNRYRELDIPPVTGLLYTLPAFVGVGRTASLLMRPRQLTAQEAFDWGLIDLLVQDDQLEPCAQLRAAEAGKYSSPNSIAAMKSLLSQHLPSLDAFFAAETREVERAVEKTWDNSSRQNPAERKPGHV
jgi:enoyl-CoA hydratase/carnithine racemase